MLINTSQQEGNTLAPAELSFRAQQSEVETSPSTMQLVVSEDYASSRAASLTSDFYYLSHAVPPSPSTSPSCRHRHSERSEESRYLSTLTPTSTLAHQPTKKYQSAGRGRISTYRPIRLLPQVAILHRIAKSGKVGP